MKELSIFAVPLTMLLAYVSYHWFELETFFKHPFLQFVFRPLNYCVFYIAVTSILLSILAVHELRHPHQPALSNRNSIDSKELESIHANIEELQGAVTDIRAMMKIKKRKSGEQE